MSSFYDELLDDTDDRVREFLAEHAFTEHFDQLSCDDAARDAPVPAPWARTALPAPIGMHTLVNVDDSNVQRSATHATCHFVVSTLNDALKATATDATSVYKCMEMELVGADVLVDAQVLEVVRPRTKERPHDCVTLKHVKYRSVLEEYQAEDLLLLEATGRGVVPTDNNPLNPSSGRAYAYKMLRSVDIPGADDVLAADADVRLELHRGWVHHLVLLFTETACPGVLRMDLWLDTDVTQTREHFHGGFTGLHDAFSLAIRYRHLVEHNGSVGTASTSATHIPQNPSTNNGVLTKTQITRGAIPALAAQHFSQRVIATAQARERACQMCSKRVGLFTRKRKHVCAVCGIFVCSVCVTPTEFNAWHLCGLCYDRNDALVARHSVAKLAASSFAKLSYLAKVKFGLERHRQSLYGSERATLLNRRATVTAARRKHSGATRLSLLPKTSGKTAYDFIAEGPHATCHGDDSGRGSLFELAGRPSAALLTPRTTDCTGFGSANAPALPPTRPYSSSTSSASGSGYSTASSASSHSRKTSDGAFDSRKRGISASTSASTSSRPTPTPTQMPVPIKAVPVPAPPQQTANDYYLRNITRSYSISKSRIQLLNDDQQNRLSARTTWRSSVQSDFASEIHSIPEAVGPQPPGRRGTAPRSYYDSLAY